jgi:hypothetical protein
VHRDPFYNVTKVLCNSMHVTKQPRNSSVRRLFFVLHVRHKTTETLSDRRLFFVLHVRHKTAETLSDSRLFCVLHVRHKTPETLSERRVFFNCSLPFPFQIQLL